MVASHTPPTRDLAHNPGMCPRPGIKPATLCLTGWHPIYRDTAARTKISFEKTTHLFFSEEVIYEEGRALA